MRDVEHDRLERNLRLVPWHEGLAHFMPWLPIFVLFTRGAFGLDDALLLASVYYFGVVAAEVPSGWLSDRIGRVPTLRLTAALMCAAQAGFLFSNDRFEIVLVSQLLLSFGFACLSGTNIAFHYDSLEAAHLEHEFEARQSRAASIAYLSGALSALVGGALGLIDLRVSFAAALAAAAGQLLVTLLMTEPPAGERAPHLLEQLIECGRHLRSPFLRWIFGYWVAMVVLEHVAFTLAQPYLTEALGNTSDRVGETPLVAGVQFAGFALVGALAARAAPRLRIAFGLFGLLVAVAMLSAAIVTIMALTVSVVVIGVMLFRSVQAAVAGIVLTAAISPLVARHQRATYLSVHSLAGRAAYGSVLLVASATVGDDLSASLVLFATISWILVALVVASLAVVPRRTRADGYRARPDARPARWRS